MTRPLLPTLTLALALGAPIAAAEEPPPPTPSAQTPLIGMAPLAPATQAPRVVLMQAAPVVAQPAPSVLVASPPIWDRAMHRVGSWLVDRAGKHQHAQLMQVVAIAPAQLPPQVDTAQLVGMPAPASPSAQSAIGAVPTPPNFRPADTPILLIPDADRAEKIRRLYGR